MCELSSITKRCPALPGASWLSLRRRCLDLWDATQHFYQHLGPGSAQPMPRPAHVYLCMMRARIAEELAFLPGSSLYERLLAGGGGSYEAGE